MSISWWATPANLHTLCRYLVEELGFDADDLLGAIEKPWNWGDEFKAAEAWHRELVAFKEEEATDG